MTATEVRAYRSTAEPGRDGFGHLVRAEFTKLRTVRGWIVGLVLAALLTVVLGVLTTVGGDIECSTSPTGPTLSGAACRQVPPTGPDGGPVVDDFYFVHQGLGDHGSITVRVTSLTGLYWAAGTARAGVGDAGMTSGTQPWSKAGIIIEQDATQLGSAYAAMTTTGSNGVRMQYDYTHDVAGLPGAPSASAPKWLRLTRSGDTITGYDSADGTRWTEVGAVTLPGLPATVQAGMFATSPTHTVSSGGLGGGTTGGAPSQATGTFDSVSVQGASAPGSAWTGTAIGGGGPAGSGSQAERFQQTGGTFAVTGSGDIAPADGQDTGRPTGQGLIGAFAGLIALIVVASLFVTSEYRRGLIRVTLTANPRRGRALAAKAVVVGAAGFVAGLVAAGVTLPLCNRLAYDHGAYLLPVSKLTEARVIVGTAGIFAVVAVLALAVGTLLKRSAATVTLVIIGIALSYILTTADVLPDGASEWLARLTPAAAFAVQQTTVAYPQVTASYTPGNGYFPLTPLEGFAVLCGYAAVALALAAYRLRRRDV
jgi:ABC-type transport system involved in multi-copper enzyme maturation permease subunit